MSSLQSRENNHNGRLITEKNVIKPSGTEPLVPVDFAFNLICMNDGNDDVGTGTVPAGPKGHVIDLQCRLYGAEGTVQQLGGSPL
ncbi:hypothetical protein KOW79_017284 [Hemibagrus wyckioides]|uniref:Uncharacterized protein n=1 Tax=Hemibagrus wyckioides TaxID=337641 RepID=A0A9D3ND22_9TELE|nr:hypothetical protein KOW79_017284 [Hemibagrus wyckioides]